MGGHHHTEYKIPNASIYKVEGIPELEQLQNELKRRGLKDPWIRNEVWRYNVKEFSTHRVRLLKFLFRGFPLGLAAAAATIAYETAFADDSHGHGHGNESHGNGNH